MIEQFITELEDGKYEIITYRTYRGRVHHTNGGKYTGMERISTEIVDKYTLLNKHKQGLAKLENEVLP